MTMTLSKTLWLACGLLTLAACDELSAPTLRPDYTIRVAPSPQGGVATKPACPSWATETANPLDNQPAPQFGCADARNLAAMVETPNDLVQPRSLGPANGVTSVGAMRRYNNNQARGLVWTGAESNQTAVSTSPAVSSSMSGDNAVTSTSSAATAP